MSCSRARTQAPRCVAVRALRCAVLRRGVAPGPPPTPHRPHCLCLAHLLTPPPPPTPRQDDWLADLNPESLVVVKGAYATPALAAAAPGDRFQLERLGYFCADPDSRPGALVLNRTCTLKESFPKQTAAKGPRK